jgi:2-keto-3-deoxy-L-fuconate dehydrogenase
MSRLGNKTALVTGGKQGIGCAIVDAFVAEGAKVLTCGRGSRPDDLQSYVGRLTCNMAHREDVEALKSFVEETFGSLSILVNNAGIQIEQTVVETTDDDWDQLMGVNAKGVFMAFRSFIPVMDTGGSIINIGSTSGNTANPGLAIYNASKAFVHGLIRSIAVDHGPVIRCTAISPGWIMTGMADGVMESAEAFYAQAGKITIRVKREVPAHVANRLQAALWRKAIPLVETGRRC